MTEHDFPASEAGAEATVSATPAPGHELVAGRYRLIELLGSGGNKQVYRAHDELLDRQVAIALIDSGDASGTLAPRLLREVRTTARLGDHPNVVTVFDVGLEGAAAYIVSQLVEGGSVADWVRQSRPGRMPAPDAARIAAQVAVALAHAHERGVLHRDVKPSNILLAADGTALLADFGLALLRDESRLTATNQIVGSPAYIAPEQAQGGKVDGRTDLYALGATLFEMVCGRPPFQGDAWDVLGQHVHAAPPDPRGIEATVPDHLADLILRLLKKDPDERPDSAREVASVLNEIGGSATSVPTLPQPLPAVLLATSSRPFVGRSSALDRLRQSWSEAQADQPTVALISGEPGIGKTRLASVFAHEAQEAGALVVYGSCDEEPLVSYQPFVEALRELAGSCPGLDRRVDPKLGAELSELGRLVPELGDVRLSGDEPFRRAEPERYLLFEAVLALFAAAADGRPLLIVLDDLQWADQPTLLLLRHVLHSPAAYGFMVVATVRPEGLATQHPLTAALARLRRDDPGRVQQVVLEGLDEAETRTLMGARGREAENSDLVRLLHELTAGNPFFIEETLRALSDLPDTRDAAAALGSLGVPAGAAEVIQRRLGRLARETVEMLTLASVCGLEFQLDVLATLKALPAIEVLAALEEAITAGVVVEPSVDRFAFCHALMRDALYEGVGSRSKRERLHLAVGEALEQLGNRPVAAAELARHFHAARHVGGAERCVQYARAAAVAAANAAAYEEAADYEVKALDGLEELGSSDAPAALAILNSLGRLRWKAGDRAEAESAFLREAELARRLGDYDHLARAALGFASRAYDAEELDPVLVGLLEEALDALPAGDSAVRARLMGALADALQFSNSTERVLDLSGEACQMARRTGDLGALVSALSRRHDALLHVEHLAERLIVGSEWLELAEQQGRADNVAVALNWTIYDRFEVGDADGAHALHGRLTEVAESLKQPLYQAFAATWDVNWLEIEGRFDEAEARAQECYRYARRAQATFGPSLYGGHLFAVRRDQGRLAEFAQTVQSVVSREPKLAAWRALILAARTAGGDVETLRPQLAQLAAKDAIPRDGFWLSAVCLLAESCTRIGDPGVAGTLLAQLEPYAETNAQMGLAFFIGPVDRYIGVLASQLGDTKRAERHLERALDRCVAFGAPVAAIAVRCDYGELLTRGSTERDRANGVRLLRRARDEAERLGMVGIVTRTEAALAQQPEVS